jgi:rhodanese-related sulfurtransferase
MENLQFQDRRRSISGSIVWLLITCVLLTWPGGCSSADSEAPTAISAEELHDLSLSGGDFLLLDVRTEREYLAARLEFTDQRIPFDSISHFADQLPTDKSTLICVFCRSGRRSEVAMLKLRSMGYSHAINVSGGIVAWQQEGYAVTSGP